MKTVRVVERFPKSYVLVEALYQPESKGGEFSPPPFRKEVMASAEFEQDLSDHLRKFPSVECSVDNPVGDPCAPKMVAAVPEFVEPSAPSAAAGPVGCEKIERSGGTNDVPSSVTLPGPFQFDEGSAAETSAIRRLADEASQKIQRDPKIECVAIKGKSAPGEPFTLANERAQLVKRLLESRGIARSRVTVFEAVAPAHTASPDDQPVLSEHRRVHLSVVVYGDGQSGP